MKDLLARLPFAAGAISLFCVLVEHRLQLVHEIADILELAIDTGESDISHLIEVL